MLHGTEKEKSNLSVMSKIEHWWKWLISLLLPTTWSKLNIHESDSSPCCCHIKPTLPVAVPLSLIKPCGPIPELGLSDPPLTNLWRLPATFTSVICVVGFMGGRPVMVIQWIGVWVGIELSYYLLNISEASLADWIVLTNIYWLTDWHLPGDFFSNSKIKYSSMCCKF